MLHPRKELEDFERFKQILEVLLKNGFGAVVHRLDMESHLPIRKRTKSWRSSPNPERLRKTFEQLGTTFIKFGQVLAQRPDILPERYTEELEELEDNVPPFDSEEARKIIEDEIGLENFEYVQEKPIAAASIAQVHRARLKTGEEVVVKVRRPGIKEKVRKDLEILEFLAKVGEKEIGKLRELKAHQMVKEFAEWTRDELDLEQEARNAQKLRKNLEEEERIKVPKVYMEHTTEKALTMEYVEGVKCNDKEKLSELDVDVEEIARTAIRGGLKQVIKDGFFHADPHPSNFLINSEGKLVYLDFGMMGKFSREMRENLGLLFLHAANEDVEAATDIVTEIATLEDDADIEGLKRDIEKKLLMVRNSTLEEHSISKELFDITVKAAERGVHMPTSFAIVGKSLVTMEGIGLAIYPQFQVTEEYEKIARKMLLDSNQPKDIMEDLLIDVVSNKEMITRPLTQIQKLASEHRKVIEKKHREKHFQTLVAGLLISSGIMLSQSLTNQLSAVIGVGQLIVAMLLLIKLLEGR